MLIMINDKNIYRTLLNPKFSFSVDSYESDRFQVISIQGRVSQPSPQEMLRKDETSIIKIRKTTLISSQDL